MGWRRRRLCRRRKRPEPGRMIPRHRQHHQPQNHTPSNPDQTTRRHTTHPDRPPAERTPRRQVRRISDNASINDSGPHRPQTPGQQSATRRSAPGAGNRDQDDARHPASEEVGTMPAQQQSPTDEQDQPGTPTRTGTMATPHGNDRMSGGERCLHAKPHTMPKNTQTTDQTTTARPDSMVSDRPSMIQRPRRHDSIPAQTPCQNTPRPQNRKNADRDAHQNRGHGAGHRNPANASTDLNLKQKTRTQTRTRTRTISGTAQKTEPPDAMCPVPCHAQSRNPHAPGTETPQSSTPTTAANKHQHRQPPNDNGPVTTATPVSPPMDMTTRPQCPETRQNGTTTDTAP